MLEFTLVSIVLIVLIFGIVEFGRAIWIYGTVAHAAREGTRYAMVRGSDSASPATAAEVEAHVRRIATGMGPSLAVTASWEDPSKDPGTIVEVEVRRPFQPLIPFVPMGNLMLKSTSRMVISY